MESFVRSRYNTYGHLNFVTVGKPKLTELSSLPHLLLPICFRQVELIDLFNFADAIAL